MEREITEMKNVRKQSNRLRMWKFDHVEEVTVFLFWRKSINGKEKFSLLWTLPLEKWLWWKERDAHLQPWSSWIQQHFIMQMSVSWLLFLSFSGPRGSTPRLPVPSPSLLLADSVRDSVIDPPDRVWGGSTKRWLHQRPPSTHNEEPPLVLSLSISMKVKTFYKFF